MVRKEVKKGVRKLSFLMALALVASLVLNLMLIGVEVEAADTIPERYDGRQFQTPARDQKQSNLCWAYSTIAALEANAIKQFHVDPNTLDFSEFHLAYFTFAGGHDDLGLTNSDTVTFLTRDYLVNGGNPGYPMAALTGGMGPVYESVVSTEQIFDSSGNVKPDAPSIKLRESLRRGSNAYDVDGAYKYAINLEDGSQNNRNAVKRAIMEYGAVATSYYSSDTRFYNKMTNGEVCFYQNQYKTYDHGVAIVGWNDNFSKTNFKSGYQPSQDGAWLVKNSWGATGDSRNLTKDGYFWLSYEDYSFTPADKGGTWNYAYAYKLRSPGKYKYMYQYDGGLNHELNEQGNLTQLNTHYANIFTSTGNQKLEAITIHTDQGWATATVNVKVYKGVDNTPESGEKVYDENVNINGNGFHTIPLKNSIDINTNQKFSIVVFTNRYTFIASDRDYAPDGSNFKVYNSTESCQSFVKNGEYLPWIDLDNERTYSYEDGASLCIKALMNDQNAHTHSWSYSNDGSNLIATCANPSCDIPGAKITITLNAANSVYNGASYSGANITGDTTNWISNFGALPTIIYSGTGATAPVNANTYSATISKDSATATASFTISKADFTGSKEAFESIKKHSGNSVTVSLPSLPEGGSYGAVNNANTDIFRVGTPASGSVTVTAEAGIETESGNKTFTIPVISTNYNDYNIAVTIALTEKESQTVSANDVTATYGDTNAKIEATATTNLKYTVKSGGDVIGVDTEGNITIKKAGSAVVTVTATETDDYAGASKDINVTINKSTPQAPTRLSGLAPTTDGGTDGKVIGVDTTMEYSANGGNSWLDVSGTEITGLSSGDIVKVRIKATDNTNESSAKDITIPNYQGSGSGDGGGSGSGGYYTSTVTPSTNSTSIPISGDTSANVNVRVQNNTAVIDAISENIINSIIKDNDVSSSEVKAVTIDLSKANANITAVTITKATAEAVAKVLSEDKNIKENLEIKLPNTTITLDDKAITAIAEQAKTDEIKIVVENTAATKLNDSQRAAVYEINKQENKFVAQTFEAYMVSGTERISDFKGGTVRVSKIDFKVPKDKNPKFYHVYYLPDKGEPVRHETWYEDGALHYETKHFSDYAIVYDETMENGQGRPVFRLWNPRNGDHLLTISTAERDACKKAGWNYEGVAFLVANNGKKVYRLYNPRTGEHFYTQSEGEKNACEKAGWNYEGIAFTTDGTKDIYRLYGGEMHLFTANADERDYLEKLGWTYEGIGFKAM